MSSTYKIDNVVVDTVTNAETASYVPTASYLKGKINVSEIAGINNDNIELKNILNGTASYALNVQSINNNQFITTITYDLSSSYAINSKNSDTSSVLSYPNTSTASYAITSAYALNALTASYANSIVSTGGMPVLIAAVRFYGGFDWNTQYAKYQRPKLYSNNVWNPAYSGANASQRITSSFNVSSVQRVSDKTSKFKINFQNGISDNNYYAVVGQLLVSAYDGTSGATAYDFNGGGRYESEVKNPNYFIISTFADRAYSSNSPYLVRTFAEPWEMEILFFKT